MSSLFNTTRLPHVFWKLKSLHVCLFTLELSLFPAEARGSVSCISLYHSRSGGPQPPSPSEHDAASHSGDEVQAARLSDWGVGSKSALEFRFPESITNLQGHQGKGSRCGWSLKSRSVLLGNSVILLVARLFALMAPACCISSLSFVSLGHALSRGLKWC